MDEDFYNILGLNKIAKKEEIKNAYKKLVLKFHPDKNNDINAQEKFQKIHLSYQILSDPEKRKKYDQLTNNQKSKIIDNIKKILHDLFDKKILSQIIVDNNIKSYLINNQHEELRNYIYNKIYVFLMSKLNIDDILTAEAARQHQREGAKAPLGADDNDLTSIFIKSNDIKNEKYYDVMGNASSYESSEFSETHSSEINLQITIHTNLEEIYFDKLKELTIHRHRYINNEYILEEKKLLVPLYDDKYTFFNEGDQIKTQNNQYCYGNVIVKIKCKKHNFIQRVNDYDLLLFLPITLYEIFNGFKKKIMYFNNENITLVSNNPLSEYKFDGDKLEIVLDNYGLPYNYNGVKERGKLFVYLLLNKDDDFNNKLKTYF
jgi:DnaJ-class molecular chaperone